VYNTTAARKLWQDRDFVFLAVIPLDPRSHVQAVAILTPVPMLPVGTSDKVDNATLGCENAMGY
jgi:hypothetical protein